MPGKGTQPHLLESNEETLTVCGLRISCRNHGCSNPMWGPSQPCGAPNPGFWQRHINHNGSSPAKCPSQHVENPQGLFPATTAARVPRGAPRSRVEIKQKTPALQAPKNSSKLTVRAQKNLCHPAMSCTAAVRIGPCVFVFRRHAHCAAARVARAALRLAAFFIVRARRIARARRADSARVP